MRKQSLFMCVLVIFLAPFFAFSQIGTIPSGFPSGMSWDSSVNKLTITGSGGVPAVSINASAAILAPSLQATGANYYGLRVSSSDGLIQNDSSGEPIIRMKTATQNVIIGDTSTDGNYRLDISKSGSAGTLRVYDQTATTGSTLFTLRSGAGQATSLLKAYDTGNANVFNIGANGEVETITGGGVTYGTQTTGNKYSVNSTGLLQFSSTSQAYDTKDAGLGRNAAGLIEANSGTLGTLRDFKARMHVTTQGGDIASASTIAPTDSVVRVTGTTTVSTITVPTNCAVASTACQITIIPTGAFATNTAGNIGLASTAVVGKALIMTYAHTQAKWYPSY